MQKWAIQSLPPLVGLSTGCWLRWLRKWRRLLWDVFSRYLNLELGGCWLWVLYVQLIDSTIHLIQFHPLRDKSVFLISPFPPQTDRQMDVLYTIKLTNKATLEIEFLHQSVNPYVTPTANENLTKIYDTISQAYRRQKSSDDFHRELEGLKKLLGESRKATGLETVCFKVKKDRVGELREGK